MNEGVKFGCGVVGFTSIVLVLIGLLSVGVMYLDYGYILPWRQNQITTINRQSFQYVETKSNLLLKLQQDYEDPNASDEQKVAIVRRMKAEVALLNPDQVPASTNAFLRGK